MSTKIRLMRFGKKKQPFYRIVVMDEDSPRNGKYIEKIGLYNPLKEDETVIDTERTLYWLNNGAKPTDTVRDMLRKQGLFKQKNSTDQTPEVSVESSAEVESEPAEPKEENE